jgi:hypothetical protein
MNRWPKLLQQITEFNAIHIEFCERMLLQNRPWEEEFLHWHWNGQRWHLHGRLLPPPGRPRSTTTTGQCQRTNRYDNTTE